MFSWILRNRRSTHAKYQSSVSSARIGPKLRESVTGMSPEGTTGRLSLFRSLGEFCGSATTAQRPKKATELSSRCRRYLTTQAAEAKSACRAGKSTSSAVRTLKNGPYRSSIGRGTQPRVTITAHVRFFCLLYTYLGDPPQYVYVCLLSVCCLLAPTLFVLTI